jgi:hypothetical protein
MNDEKVLLLARQRECVTSSIILFSRHLTVSEMIMWPMMALMN